MERLVLWIPARAIVLLDEDPYGWIKYYGLVSAVIWGHIYLSQPSLSGSVMDINCDPKVGGVWSPAGAILLHNGLKATPCNEQKFRVIALVWRDSPFKTRLCNKKKVRKFYLRSFPSFSNSKEKP